MISYNFITIVAISITLLFSHSLTSPTAFIRSSAKHPITPKTESIKFSLVYGQLQTSAFSIFFGTILLTIFLPASVNEAMEAPTIQLFYIAILGIFSSAVAYVAWSNAFAKAKQTSLVSNYMFLTPFLTSALGFVVAKEIPDFATLIGGGIIIFGILLFYFGDKAYIKLN